MGGGLAPSWNLTATPDIADPGIVAIEGGGATVVPIGSAGTLLKFRFQVKCLDLPETVTPITIKNYAYDLDDLFSPDIAFGDFTFTPCARLGDVNQDLNVTPGDAQQAFEIFLGLRIPNFCQDTISDVDCNAATTPGDAQDIFEHFLRILNLPECCAASAATNSDMASIVYRDADFEKRNWRITEAKRLYPLSMIAEPGDLVRIPLIITNPEDIYSFGFEMAYPTDLLEFVRIKKSHLTQGFDFIAGTEMDDGYVLVEGDSETPVLSGTVGALVVAVFKVKKGFRQSRSIEIFNPQGDIYDYEVRKGQFLRVKPSEEEPCFINLGQDYLHKDGTLRIPVEVSSAFKMKSFGMEFKYAQDQLIFLGVERAGVSQDFMALEGTEVKPGKLRVGGFSLSQYSKRGRTTLFELVFSPSGDEYSLEIIQLLDDLYDYFIR